MIHSHLRSDFPLCGILRHIRITDSNSIWELKNGRIQHFHPIVNVEQLHNWIQKTSPESKKLANAVIGVSLCRIIEKMVSDGHGGTLLLGTSQDQQLSYKYKAHSRVLQNAIADCADIEQVLLQPDKMDDAATIEAAHFARRSLIRAIDTVASLTSVDGATVIGNDLSIIGFGTEITYEPVEPNTEIKCLARSVIGFGHDIIEVGKRRMADFGMRHRSAYGYCNQDENAIAIVVSQDGGIRVFCTDSNNTTVLYQNVIPEPRTYGWLRP